jgi:hypothetical protein
MGLAIGRVERALITALRDLPLAAALLAYGAVFAILYPIAASSAAKSVSFR